MKSDWFKWLFLVLWTVVSGSALQAAAPAQAWKALDQLDHVVGKVQGLDVTAQRSHLPDLVKALAAASPDLAPKSVRENLVANFLLGDIHDIASQLKKGDGLSDQKVSDLVNSLHPLLEALLDETGIPLQCSNPNHQHGASKPSTESEHDHHDHDGHNH